MSDTPEGKSTLEIIESIKDTPELKTLLENNAKEYWKTNIGGELKNIYSTLDSTVKDVIGAEKPENVKTSEWIKQNLEGLKTAKKELETLKASKGSETSELEKLHNQKIEKLTKALKEKEGVIGQLSQKGYEQKLDNDINIHLMGKTFKPTLAEAELQDLTTMRKERMKRNSKELENGTIVYYKDDAKTEPYLDTLSNPMTTQQVSDIVFGSLYHTGKKGGGAVAETDNAAPQGEVVAIDMSAIKTKAEFYTAFKKLMAPKGLTSLDKEFQTKQRATMEHYKITELPLSE